MIKPKKGICIDCPRGAGEVPLIAKRCQNHYWQYRSSLKGEKAGKSQRNQPIARKSDNQIEREIEYAKLRKSWLLIHWQCEARVKECEVVGNHIHHMAGRSGDLLCDTEKWLVVCYKCHAWITEHSKEAIEMGLSLRRNS